MKRIVATILIVALLSIAIIAIADPNGVVTVLLTKWATVRSRPDYSSSALASAKNGQELVVTKNDGTWAQIDMRASGFNRDGYGYVASYYLKYNAYYYEIPYDDFGEKRYIQAYNDPWSGLSNGQVSSGQKYLVTYETPEWLVVQLPANEGGSGFIKKTDLKIYDWSYGTPNYPDGYYEAESNVGVWYRIKHYNYNVRVGIRKEIDLSLPCMVILHEGDMVRFDKIQGNFAKVYYVDPYGYEYTGWVDTQYFIKVE